MKKIAKLIKFIGAITILLLIVALIFPTWTSQIKGQNSISTLEKVEINGSDHEIMIRGKDKSNPVIILYMVDLVLQKYHMLKSIKIIGREIHRS